MSGESSPTQIQAQWLLDAGAVPSVANQILVQPGVPVGPDGAQDGFYVTFGHLSPPIVNGASPEEAAAFVATNVFPVIPIGRFFTSRARLAHFHEEIGKVLEQTQGIVQ